MFYGFISPFVYAIKDMYINTLHAYKRRKKPSWSPLGYDACFAIGRPGSNFDPCTRLKTFIMGNNLFCQLPDIKNERHGSSYKEVPCCGTTDISP